jgi:hypothetical protein
MAGSLPAQPFRKGHTFLLLPKKACQGKNGNDAKFAGNDTANKLVSLPKARNE